MKLGYLGTTSYRWIISSAALKQSLFSLLSSSTTCFEHIPQQKDPGQQNFRRDMSLSNKIIIFTVFITIYKLFWIIFWFTEKTRRHKKNENFSQDISSASLKYSWGGTQLLLHLLLNHTKIEVEESAYKLNQRIFLDWKRIRITFWKCWINSSLFWLKKMLNVYEHVQMCPFDNCRLMKSITFLFEQRMHRKVTSFNTILKKS